MLTTGESNDWTILGNTGTNPSTNFLGTSDAQDLVIRTNNIERIRTTSNGDVGIGIALPTAKTHVLQSDAVDGILSSHSGTAGNAIEVLTTGASNLSSAMWLRNSTSGAGLNVSMDNAGNLSPGIVVNQTGVGSGIMIFNSNTGANPQAMYIDQDGTDPFSRGIDIYMDAANSAIGSSVFHAGSGTGQYVGMTNNTSPATGSVIIHDGLGTGQFIELSNATSTMSNSFLVNEGLGRGQQILLNNANNNQIGTGLWHNGTGVGNYLQMTNTASNTFASYIYNQGLGYGQYVYMDNTAANTDSIGMMVSVSGNATTGGGGGGNAVEIQHNGSNSNALEVFIGDPATAPGPANTTSDYANISTTHMGTGASVVGTKSGLNTTNYSADPTIVAINNGTDEGSGLEAYVTPSSNDPIAIIGVSNQNGGSGNGLGIGVQGYGRWYGLQGIQGGTAAYSYAVYGAGDYGGTGVKYFTIDHPLDPENKILNHYSIESNEVTNMYRGIVTLDDSGKATVKLPNYFSAANTNPSYQLTPIGTGTQPYVLKEVMGNQFTVGGAPNTKISWTVFAKRNDPTIKYFDEAGKNYDQEIVDKPAKMRGKYFTPEAYGKDKSEGIFYRADREEYAKRMKSYSAEKMKHKDPNVKAPDNKQFKKALTSEQSNFEENTDKNIQTKK